MAYRFSLDGSHNEVSMQVKWSAQNIANEENMASEWYMIT